MHAIETFENMAAFASLRQPAWHGLGTVFDRPVTTEEMLSLSHLGGWNLRLENAEDIAGMPFASPTRFVIRDNPFTGEPEVLGTVGGRYAILPNEHALQFLAGMTGNLRWETAGSLKNGTVIFATMADPDDLTLDPNGSADKIRRYFMVTTSHDGSGMVLITEIYLRVECANTLAVAIQGHGPSVRVKHTAKMEDRMRAGAKAIGMLKPHRDAMDAALEKMIQAEMTKDKFWEIVSEDLMPLKGDSKNAVTRRENRLDSIMNIWSNGTGSVGNLENTAYKGWQVLNEAVTWGRTGRMLDTAEGQENYFAAVAGLTDATQREDQTSFNRFLAFATA